MWRAAPSRLGPEPSRYGPGTAAGSRSDRTASWLLATFGGLVGAVAVVVASPASRIDTSAPPSASGPSYRDLALFGDAFHAVRTWAADVHGDSQLIDAAIAGMVASLDGHSRYLTAAEFRRLNEQDAGSYAGIGVAVEAGGKIRATHPDTPAARAGLMGGSVIERIDGITVGNLDPDQVADLLRGEPSSTVRLLVVRPGQSTPAEVVLTREWLPVHPVRMRALGTVAYIGLDHFDEFTTSRLLKAVATLRTSIGRGRLSGVVLDLRGNPGGLVVQAVAVAGAFLGRGEIVRLIGRGDGDVERFALTRVGGDSIGDLPLVVLVDGGTASASEIVTGALQDHRRATVIGTPPYGKGAVQTTYAHRNGRGLRLTTAWAVTPSGRKIEENGIQPDRVVPRGGATVEETGRQSAEPDKSAGSLQGGIVEDRLIDPSRDRQLTAALNHLQAASQVGDDGLIHRNDPVAGR